MASIYLAQAALKMPLNTAEDPLFNKQVGDQFYTIFWELVSTKNGCSNSAEQNEPCVSRVPGTCAMNLKHLVSTRFIGERLTAENLEAGVKA